MCGIAGTYKISNKPISKEEVDKFDIVKRVLFHRGPDQQGLHNDENGIIVNTRLSILDHSSKAALPMSNEDQSIWITYNGEVSNFMELKKRFQLHKKYSFRTTSDRIGTRLE